MKITICSSIKYKDLVKETMENFKALGIKPLFPNLDYNSTNNKDNTNTTEEKKRLALEHYEAINNSDKVYFITPEGYMGTSLKLELGYTIAKKSPSTFQNQQMISDLIVTYKNSYQRTISKGFWNSKVRKIDNHNAKVRAGEHLK